MAARDTPPTYAAPRQPLPHLSSADFETASIRSAAPSYLSEAPTYHSTLPGGGLPPSNFSSLPSSSSFGHSRRPSATPSLNDFRISTWSTTRSNPTARHYHSVANRRATIASAQEERKMMAAAASANPVAAIVQTLEEEEREKYGNRVRPLEDEELVGREAAEKAKRERLGWGREVLIREDKRWDWLLDQMKDWEEREKSWNNFRKEVEQSRRGKLARRLGLK